MTSRLEHVCSLVGDSALLSTLWSEVSAKDIAVHRFRVYDTETYRWEAALGRRRVAVCLTRGEVSIVQDDIVAYIDDKPALGGLRLAGDELAPDPQRAVLEDWYRLVEIIVTE